MAVELTELRTYRNFDEMANDVLEIAKEVLPEKLLYLTTFTNQHQIILKLSNSNTEIKLYEGMKIELGQTVCNRIRFKQNEPLVYEDLNQANDLEDLKPILQSTNIQSYLGIPILLSDGEPFGTLCSAHTSKSHFDPKSIQMLQRVAKLFVNYLELERLAYRDYLTGLYNRQYVSHYFETHSQTEGALFFLDLDGFKAVNDNLGHERGDDVLKEVANHLIQLVDAQKGFAVRLGGDEFILMFREKRTQTEWKEMANSLLSRLSDWEPPIRNLSASIGIVPYTPTHTQSFEKVLKRADQALYQAKAQGKNTFQFADH